MTIRWPTGVLRPRNVAFDIASRSLAGASSVSGRTQVVSSDAGIWKATLGDIVIRDRNTRLAFRAIANLLEGRLGTILVPLCRGDQPAPQADGLFEQVPHDDDAYFDDDTGYVGGATLVTLNDDLAVRAVSAEVTIAYGGEMEPGQHFSLGERLYRLRTVEYSSDTAATITFRPPLREAVDADTELNFDDPVCRMRLVSDAEMDL